MIKEVRSLGGPLLMLETRLWPKWGGIDTNSATKGETNDYEFICKIRSYIGVIDIEGASAVILNDMPMDTTVIYNPHSETTDIVRVMNSNFPEIEEIIAQYLQVDKVHMRSLPQDDIDEITFQSSRLVISESTCTSTTTQWNEDYLEFDLPSLRCSITSYDCETPDLRLIIHQIKGL